jgi:HK97 family phage major capsid protein
MHPPAYDKAGLGADHLRRFLLTEIYSHKAADRLHARWVMNGEWALECRKLASDSGGSPWWTPPVNPDALSALFGFPVEVRKDGGVPHLELGEAAGHAPVGV